MFTTSSLPRLPCLFGDSGQERNKENGKEGHEPRERGGESAQECKQDDIRPRESSNDAAARVRPPVDVGVPRECSLRIRLLIENKTKKYLRSVEDMAGVALALLCAAAWAVSGEAPAGVPREEDLRPAILFNQLALAQVLDLLGGGKDRAAAKGNRQQDH